VTIIGEECVFWNETYYAETFDFRGRVNLRRYDECSFIKCTIFIDEGTEELAFTGCTFQNCNVDRIEQDEWRRIISKGNLFDRPLDEKRQEFDDQLAAALRNRDKR